MATSSWPASLPWESPDGALDPAADGVEIVVGAPGRMVVLSVPPGDIWRIKGTKATWKSPRDSVVKIKIVVDTAARTFSIPATKLQLATAPANPVSVRFGGGDDAGSVASDWAALPKGGLKIVPE